VAVAGASAASHELDWIQDEAAAFARARSEGKGVVVDFYAAWCVPCTNIEAWLATREALQVIAPRFVALRFDVTEDSEEAAERRRRYDAETLPALLFLDADGQVLERLARQLESAGMLDLARAASAKLHGVKSR